MFSELNSGSLTRSIGFSKSRFPTYKEYKISE